MGMGSAGEKEVAERGDGIGDCCLSGTSAEGMPKQVFKYEVSTSHCDCLHGRFILVCGWCGQIFIPKSKVYRRSRSRSEAESYFQVKSP